MTPGQQRRKDNQDEARRIQQADEKIEELYEAIDAALGMLDRFSGDMSDEAYEEVEAILGNALDPDFPATSRLEELKQEVERLRTALLDVGTGLSFYLRPDVHRKPSLQEIRDFHSGINDALNGGGADT